MRMPGSQYPRHLPPWHVTKLAIPLGLLAVCAGHFAVWAWGWFEMVRDASIPIQVAFHIAHAGPVVDVLLVVSTAASAMLFFSASLALFVRNKFTLSLLRKSCLMVGFWFALYAYTVFNLTGILQEANIEWNGVKPDAVSVFFWRYDHLWPGALAVLWAVLLYIGAWRRPTINFFTGQTEAAPARGDVVVENIRTHGEDPVYRKSWLSSVSLHVFVLILLPLLLNMLGCVDPYRVPFGSGEPVVALVQIVKPKKEKKKKYILRPNSDIYFHVPELDESEVVKIIDQMTQVTYKADPNARAGKMGRGGGKQGGWPEGMKNGVVRFIRLEHNGRGWNDGMDSSQRADMNFLDEFHKQTGFKIASKPESHPIRLLPKYDKGFAPPFVYLTGDGGMSINANDTKILREYLIGGGMLFADAGSPEWDRSLRGFMAQLFPGEPLRVIADDDPIFQMPYTFANGAPPLWHHGGMRALGIKHKGRWVVFYHPGDINDAWKTGHSGISPELARGAFQMGINIVYYAFTNYLEETAKYRK